VAHIFWDFDGTLVRSSPLWRKAMLKALDQACPGHSLKLDDLKPLVSVGFPWHSESPHDLTTPTKWWAYMNDKFARDFEAVGIEPSLAKSGTNLIRNTLLDPDFYEVFPEVPEVLAELKAAGWKHIILSNNHPDLEQVVQVLNLRPYFEEIVTSAAVGYEKPRAEIFEWARRLAGADFSRSWMVGDNPRADIYGAERAGLPNILVRADGEAKRKARDLFEVSRIISANR
jgi:putative hydrolase of the HAD superfamily